MSIDFAGINASLLARAHDFLLSLFPAGVREGHEFKIGDISGTPGRSLSINMNTGVGKDFSSGDGYGDLIALYAAHHQITMGEAAKELGSDSYRESLPPPPAPDVPRETPSKKAIVPAPADAPPPPSSLRLKREGQWIERPVVASWAYYLPNGGLVGHVCRVEFEDGKKDVLPLIWCDGAGGPRWRQGSFPKPRPLYNATQFLPGDRVLIVEGEKVVEHAKRMGLKRHPICWPGGGNAVKLADWSGLRGCDVLLFPDHDAPGRKAMAEIAERLLAIDCKVSVIDTAALDLPTGWDLADTDWTREEFAAWVKPLVRSISQTPQKPAEAIIERGRPRVTAGGDPPNGGALLGEGNAFANWGVLGLDLDSKGIPHAHLANFIGVLTRHPRLKGKIWFDEFHNRSFERLLQDEPKEISDVLDLRLTEWLQASLRIPKASKWTVRDAINAVAAGDVRNEPVDWLNGIAWDGIERLALMFCDGWGAEDTPYIRSISSNFLIGMVARLYQPGCQVDYLPVFEGGQGIGKSKVLRALGGKYYAENHEEIGSKDFFQNLPGKMLIEFAELHALSRKDVKLVKAIISSPVDRYRESYSYRAADHRRRNVFSATTNELDWNNDETGARRFWPVTCGEINPDFILGNRDQLFAEAVHRYRAGEPWWVFDEATATDLQNTRRTDDPWTDKIRHWLDFASPEVFVEEVMEQCLVLPVQQRDMSAARRIGSVLRLLGLEKKNLRIGGRQRKVWVLPSKKGSEDPTSSRDF